MTIKRISKIKNHRVFHEFVWSAKDLPDFGQKNLFYGWNGSGKSTLSNLFQSIEKKTPISEGEVEFVIFGKKVNGANISTNQELPEVRVFNKDFIANNVFTGRGSVTPIFFLGEENVKKQKQLKKLKEELATAEERCRDEKNNKRQTEKTFDDFKKKCAKSIKNLLSSSGGNNSYNNYDKRSYQTKCEEMAKLSDTEQREKILEESKLNEQKRKKETISLDKLPLLEFSYPDTQQLTDQVVALLKKTVVSSVIETLKNDQELSVWVKTGLAKHQKDHSDDCLFCGQPLPDKRIQELESHFNDKYNEFINEIEKQSAAITSEIDRLESYTSPINRLQLYEHLRTEFDDKTQILSNEISRIRKYLKNLLAVLEDKAEKPFQPIEQSFEIVAGNVSVISDLNSEFDKHNQETDGFEATISLARTTIEESLVAENLPEYQQKKNDVCEVASTSRLASKKVAELKKDIHEIEKDIKETHRPLDKLNTNLHSYLGTDEITFEIQGNGYQIRRNGTPAEDLSEGEKTAIAFLYFLESLRDKSFSLEDGIVVIDDPVSSLDSNALFSAFGFMKDRTENAGQLFILTHSHPFFRQVKNWFNHLPNQKKNKEKFYMLNSNVSGGCRSSSISKLDNLLYDYESEYHYLFKLVYEAANSEENSNLQQNYHLPNIARRLLESFFAFRQPLKSGKLQKQIDLVDFDVAKKKRILRFLHTYSHADQISDPEHDPSILIETKQVLNELLCLIRKDDDRHFNQMKALATK